MKATGRAGASAGVREEWGRRVFAEVNSAGVTGQLFVALQEVGAPPAVLSACHTIIGDELRHSAQSHEVFTAAGGSATALARFFLPPAQAAPVEWPPLHRALSITISMFCCGETVAVPLFVAMFRRARQPAARAVLHGILKDEGRHRAFGWSTLKELLRRASAADVRLARRWARDAVHNVVDAYSHGTWEPTREDAAWGVLGPEDYRRLVGTAARTVIAPRLARLGLPVTR